jgi:hypothetical protein
MRYTRETYLSYAAGQQRSSAFMWGAQEISSLSDFSGHVNQKLVALRGIVGFIVKRE